MSYHVRAFCPTATIPTIRALVAWLRDEAGLEAEVPGGRPAKLDSPSWKSFELVYRPGTESVLVECLRDTGPRSLARRTARDEAEALDGLPDSEARRRVADCLARTRFIICCRVDRDPDHREAFAVRSVLDYFVDHCGALLDTEDEGFYSCSDLPLLDRCTED
jgi:hypothetical protein